jgi:hypothetical protein
MLFYGSCLDHVFDVLVEGPHAKDKTLMTGAGENYLPFVFPKDDRLRGHVVQMRAVRIAGDKVLGKIQKPH